MFLSQIICETSSFGLSFGITTSFINMDSKDLIKLCDEYYFSQGQAIQLLKDFVKISKDCKSIFVLY